MKGSERTTYVARHYGGRLCNGLRTTAEDRPAEFEIAMERDEPRDPLYTEGPDPVAVIDGRASISLRVTMTAIAELTPEWETLLREEEWEVDLVLRQKAVAR